MLLAVVKHPAAGRAGMTGEAASLQHRDDLVLTVRAGHAFRMSKGDNALVARPVAAGGSLEVDGAAFVAAHSGGGCR